MTPIPSSQAYAFNGDADGLCALQQLRRAAGPGYDAEALLVTGVKRDIALLDRVPAIAGQTCTVLDVSLDVNRAALVALLESDVRVRYFDHHFAGEVPRHPNLDAHLDPSPNTCTSLLVDRSQGGRFRRWAIVGAFGDSLTAEATALATAAGLSPADTAAFEELGVAINYNAYGETLADLHVSPVDLAADMLPFEDPREFLARSAAARRLAGGFRADLELARRLPPHRAGPGAVLYLLPDAAWARRASGTLANDRAKAHADSAVAIVSPKTTGGYLVSIRVPRDAKVSAEVFCRRFPTGGGRRTAAGINHLPEAALDDFAAAFLGEFQTG
jgi:hypothetical protein